MTEQFAAFVGDEVRALALVLTAIAPPQQRAALWPGQYWVNLPSQVPFLPPGEQTKRPGSHPLL